MHNWYILYILKNYKFLSGLIIVITLFNFILYLSLIRNQEKQIRELQQAYIEQRKTVEENINDKTQQYFAAQKSILSFKEHLPETSEFAGRVKELNTVLHKHGLSISRMIFKPTKIDNLSLWKYTTSITVSGKYRRLKSLLANIQNLPGLFCIENISFKNRSEKREKVDMSITMSTYFR
ncbi:MAG: type 4a pilus biogenesis protein PilO [Deltaproteobacteria bacterium]|nr:type 4a pilus biogenesis protein PilO [Deltaproteobacteria bacterium]